MISAEAGGVNEENKTCWPKIVIKFPPDKPKRTEYHKPFTYYFDDNNYCYGMIHDYFNEFMGVHND